MIHHNLYKILHNNTQISDFLTETESFEILVKRLNHDEIYKLNDEYPFFIKKNTNNHKAKKNQVTENESFQFLSCITIVKHDINIKNYVKLKKIKIYIDELNERIIKILEN